MIDKGQEKIIELINVNRTFEDGVVAVDNFTKMMVVMTPKLFQHHF